jgi:hypothetical protein
MKKMIVGGLAALATALGIAAAVPAQATTGYDPGSAPYGGGYMGDQDAYAYRNLLADLGAGYSAAEAQKFGLTMCNGLASGMSEAQITSIGVSSGVPAGDARLAVHGAEYHFCPGYY